MDLSFKFPFLISIHIAQVYSTPKGYIGCFDDKGGHHLPIALKTSDTNSGEECKQRCSDKGYRYAGTKAANQCHCGTTLIKKQAGTKCVLECTGNHKEKCGGFLHISIYDTWQCIKGPCGNNAVGCTDISASNYSCICRVGWEGRNCSKESISTKSTSVLVVTATSTKSTRKESNQTETTLNRKTFVGISNSTLAVVSVRNKTITKLTTESMRVTNTEKENFILYILMGTSVFIVCALVAVIAFFVGRQRGKQTTRLRQDVRAVSQDNEYNELVNIVHGYSSPYSAVGEIQYDVTRASKDSTRISDTSYLTPCTSTQRDSSNEYEYIDS